MHAIGGARPARERCGSDVLVSPNRVFVGTDAVFVEGRVLVVGQRSTILSLRGGDLGRCGALTILEFVLHDVRITVVEAWATTEWDGEWDGEREGERGRAAWERSAVAGGGG